MSERIISDEVLESIRRTCYEAGKAGREAFTVRGTDGPEVIRCRDCGMSHEDGWRCARWVTGTWDEDLEEDFIELEVVRPDGYCFMATRREA